MKKEIKFGKYIRKAQTGMEANAGTNNPPNNSNNNGVNWGALATQVTPLVTQWVNQQQASQRKKNTYTPNDPNDPYFNQVNNSPYAGSIVSEQEKERREKEMGDTAATIALNAALPGAGLLVPATNAIINSAYPEKRKYGITYYDSDTAAMAHESGIGARLRNAVTFEHNPNKTGAGNFLYNIGDLFTLGSLSALNAPKKNKENKDKIKDLERIEETLRKMNEQRTQGIYAKKGVSFGKYKMYQTTNIPKHKDNKVLDTVDNREYPALEKGAGGAVILFGKGNEKKKVLIENGEYVVVDEDGEIIGVLPKKIGKKVVQGEIPIEEAFDKVPDVDDAETAKVMQDGGVYNKEKKFTIKDMIYEDNPILASILQSDKRKLIAKKGLVNEDGYLKNSKNKNNPVNIIKGNVITTENMAFPIYANGKLLHPNTGDYKFPSSYVVETPAANIGIKRFGKYRKKAQKGIGDFKGKDTDWADPDVKNDIKNYEKSKKEQDFPHLQEEIVNLKTKDLTDIANQYNEETRRYLEKGIEDFPYLQEKDLDPKTNNLTNTLINMANLRFKNYEKDKEKEKIVDLKTKDLADIANQYDKETRRYLEKRIEDLPDSQKKDIDKQKDKEIDWTDPDIKDYNEGKKIDWFDPDIEAYNKGLKENKIINNNTNKFKAIDPNTAFSYGLGLYQLWSAYNAKPSERGAYTFSPEITKILADYEYRKKFGDQAGYKEALDQIEASRMQALKNAQMNASSGSYASLISSLTRNIGDLKQEAYRKYISEEQEKNREKYNQYVYGVYQPNLDKVFNDAMARYQEHQNFLTGRQQAIMNALGYMNDVLQNRKTNAIQQYNEYLNQMDSHNRNLIEYKLLYGTPEEKEEAKQMLENPDLLYSRMTPKYFGFSQPINKPFGSYNRYNKKKI